MIDWRARLRMSKLEALLHRAIRLQEVRDDIGWFKHQIVKRGSQHAEDYHRDPMPALIRAHNFSVGEYNSLRFRWMPAKRPIALPPSPFDDHFA